MGKDWNNKDLEDSLRRAFADDIDGTILIDGHELRSEFKQDGLRYGLDQGFLEKASEGGDEQYTAFYYKLTRKGQVHFNEKKLANHVASISIYYCNIAGGEMILKNNTNIPNGLGGFSDSNEERRASLNQENNEERKAYEGWLEDISREDLVKGLQKDLYKRERDAILADYDALMEE